VGPCFSKIGREEGKKEGPVGRGSGRDQAETIPEDLKGGTPGKVGGEPRRKERRAEKNQIRVFF